MQTDMHRGIYYIENQWFPMQVVVISELDHREHQWIRALTEKLSEDEAAVLLNKASEASGTGIEDLVDSVMTVSMAANKGSFKPLISYEKGDLGMYQFAKILFEDEIKEEKMKTAKRMLADGDLSYKKIAVYSGLSIEEVESLAKELESKLQTV